jgi:hypothetical protein
VQLVELPAFTLRDFADVSIFERSPGLHLTDITGLIMKRVDPKRYAREFDEADSENWQEAGFIWEEILGEALAARALRNNVLPWGELGEVRFRPGEVELDGITMSPDALAFLPGRDEPVLEEYKATWKSMTPWMTIEDPDERKVAALEDTRFLPYLLQIKSYLKGVGGRRARLVIFFINGDYKAYIPRARGFELTFTQRELDENWTMIKNTARKEGWL